MKNVVMTRNCMRCSTGSPWYRCGRCPSPAQKTKEKTGIPISATKSLFAFGTCNFNDLQAMPPDFSILRNAVTSKLPNAQNFEHELRVACFRWVDENSHPPKRSHP